MLLKNSSAYPDIDTNGILHQGFFYGNYFKYPRLNIPRALVTDKLVCLYKQLYFTQYYAIPFDEGLTI